MFFNWLKNRKKIRKEDKKGIKKAAVPEPEYATGKAKQLDDLTFKDFKEHPVWIFALDEETEDGMDETCVKPVTDTDNADSSMVEAYILLKEEKSGVCVFGRIDIEDMYVDDLWYEDPATGKPTELTESEYEDGTFVAVAKINGEADCRFRYDREQDRLVTELEAEARGI